MGEAGLDADYLRELADLVLRMLHVVAGIAWIGASFYFIRLDLGLRLRSTEGGEARGVAGEYWGVHGGGFYHSQKYKVAPLKLPEHLHWFKWEAYTTWLSGFALLVVLYWLEAGERLVDPAVADLRRAAGGRRSRPAGSCWRGSSTTARAVSSGATGSWRSQSPCS